MAIEDPSWPRADRWLARGHPEPDVLVVGVPTSSASLTPSAAAAAPAAVRSALSRFSTFHGEWDIDLDPVRIADRGDLAVDHLDMWAMPAAVEAAVGPEPAALALYLGGDNAITRPLVRATGGGDLSRIGLLTFDAHHDVRTLDRGPTNATHVRGLIEEDGLPGAHVSQIGIHSFANSLPYRRWCEDAGITIHTMSDVETWGIDDVVAVALDELERRCEHIYVDVDLDVLDSAVAPGCPGARPGGMGVRQLALAVRRCGARRAVTAIDFVEVDPARDPAGVTVDAYATALLSAVAGFSERNRGSPPAP
ncbi:MAG: arginase family protein [Acidimicrobiia bacterium]